jgi:hypothetical protein
LLCTAIWVDSGNITLTEISQTQRTVLQESTYTRDREQTKPQRQKAEQGTLGTGEEGDIVVY